jgi:hypothetical protein
MTSPDLEELPGLVERLRAKNSMRISLEGGGGELCFDNPDGPEAADTLESLAAENERLREALGEIAETPNLGWLIARKALGEAE